MSPPRICLLVGFFLMGTSVWAGEDSPSAAHPEPVADIIRQMAEDDFAGLAACRKLVSAGEAAVPALIEALQSPVPRVRYWSIAALSGIADERAVPAIAQRLNDPNPMVRAVAVWHLGRWFERPDVQHAVVNALEDKSTFVRGWALRLIEAKKYRPATAAVRRMLEAEEPEVRYDALHTLAVLLGPDAMPDLKAALKDESPLVRECALRCCTVLQPPTVQAAEVLLRGLEDPDPQLRALAVRLLRKGFGQFFGFDPDGDPEARRRAVEAWRQWLADNADHLQWNSERRRFELAQEAPTPSPNSAPLPRQQWNR